MLGTWCQQINRIRGTGRQ